MTYVYHHAQEADNDKLRRDNLTKNTSDQSDVRKLKEENVRLQNCVLQLEQQMMDAEHEHTKRSA